MDITDFLRQLKIGPFAVFDLAISYIGIYLISPTLTKLASKTRLQISRTQWLWLVLPSSIIIHIIFGQKTPLTDMFLDPNNFYIIKIVIIFMLVMGLKDTKFLKK